MTNHIGLINQIRLPEKRLNIKRKWNLTKELKFEYLLLKNG
jgi:hypothetical protein